MTNEKQAHRIDARYVRLTALPFFVVSAILFAIAAVMYLSFPIANDWHFALILFLFLSWASFLFVYPFVAHYNYIAALRMKDALHEIKQTVLDAENVLRAHGRLLLSVQSLHSSVEETVKKVEQLHDVIVVNISAIKQKEADLQETRREIERYAKRDEHWVETVMEFTDYLHRLETMLSPGDERPALVRKIASDLARYASRTGFEIIAPEVGAPFIPELHEAVGEEPAIGVSAEPGQILRCEKWGYRYNGAVKSRARVVIVASPGEKGSSPTTNCEVI